MNIIVKCNEQNCEFCSEVLYKLIPTMISISSEKKHEFLLKLLNSKKPKLITMNKKNVLYLNCKEKIPKMKEEAKLFTRHKDDIKENCPICFDDNKNTRIICPYCKNASICTICSHKWESNEKLEYYDKIKYYDKTI